MTTDKPDWARNLEAAATQAAAALAHTGHILRAQGAMGWAYRGDIERLRQVLADMQPEQLHELSAAAGLLASCVDEALSGTT